MGARVCPGLRVDIRKTGGPFCKIARGRVAAREGDAWSHRALSCEQRGGDFKNSDLMGSGRTAEVRLSGDG
jgi:hypothetical protein